MKRHIILKNFMIAIPTVMILLSLVTQIASVEHIWFIASLVTWLSAIVFRMTDRITLRRSPLDWVFTGNVVTVFFLAFELTGGDPVSWPTIVVFTLSLCETLLTVAYWIGRRLAFLP